VNEREQIWVQWFLGVFGIAGLGLGLALMGFSIERQMGWMAYALGALAFGIVPWLAVACRPPALSGGIMGIAMAIGGFAILLMFASIYGIGFPPLAVVMALLLAFIGGSIGEPSLGAR
jgi:hypothetical protein